ncbi:MAG TPA: class I SAM-dependent RNA methyltransferase [Ferruginibacter sp.]|nr:class I SAM-dependent RNA methyltransferase [Ferruginibacter sp.]HRO07064.1 class I SAM-dependent RNA methyltransferase [Ferruginibacter sp.]HRO97354.1 class I SAM-dependent RNA methyltransferase [Ferruginibacter sp.]HRP50571.1 class I SAM-dependent RNA methyltransferase [Ferruginibacter sp.]
MNIWTSKSRIVITCSNRIAPWLQKEVETLGYKVDRVFKTGVELTGSMEDCIRLNLNLRCASQILFSIHSFRAENADMLYRELVKLPWEQWIPHNGYFCITGNVRNPTITNSLFANVKVKDAIADRFRDQTGKRPDSGADPSATVISLFWQDDYAEVFFDTSGETLSKHGYRKIPGKAPMMESLAAATLLATAWNRTSPFINPMCGSGTLAIEAALLATRRMPGLYRSNYGFMHITGYAPAVYDRAMVDLKAQIQSVPTLKIIATDISEDAVHITKVNAGIAGVADLIEYAVCDFAQSPVPPDAGGVVFFNPEYGDRLGVETALQPVYRAMGDFMKQQCKGYRGYIFTGNLELAKHIGLKPKRRIEFFNGKIDCRLLEYELYAGTKDQRKQA